jgi:predicted dinucleotide-binding enzyme
MKVAVLGSGARPTAIARLLEGGGHEVATSGAAGNPPPYDAATGSEVVVFAGERDRLDALVTKVGRLLPETVIVDAMEGGEPPPRQSNAELLAHRLDSHRVVRASVLLPVPNASVLLAGDDPEAVGTVEELFRTSGCVTAARGPLARAAEIEPPRSSTHGAVAPAIRQTA